MSREAHLRWHVYVDTSVMILQKKKNAYGRTLTIKMELSTFFSIEEIVQKRLTDEGKFFVRSSDVHQYLYVNPLWIVPILFMKFDFRWNFYVQMRASSIEFSGCIYFVGPRFRSIVNFVEYYFVIEIILSFVYSQSAGRCFHTLFVVALLWHVWFFFIILIHDSDRAFKM